MQEVQIEIDVSAEHYNHWPLLKVLVNDTVLYDGEVIEKATLFFKVECKDSNALQLVHYGKHFGDNNIWDSSPDGSGSCALTVTDIRFNEVSIGESLMSKLEFVTTWLDDHIVDEDFKKEYERFNSNGSMSFNGSITLDFDTPVYDWLIISKFKVPITDTATFSNYSLRWHYGDDIELLNEIKGLLTYE